MMSDLGVIGGQNDSGCVMAALESLRPNLKRFHEVEWENFRLKETVKDMENEISSLRIELLDFKAKSARLQAKTEGPSLETHGAQGASASMGNLDSRQRGEAAKRRGTSKDPRTLPGFVALAPGPEPQRPGATLSERERAVLQQKLDFLMQENKSLRDQQLRELQRHTEEAREALASRKQLEELQLGLNKHILSQRAEHLQREKQLLARIGELETGTEALQRQLSEARRAAERKAATGAAIEASKRGSDEAVASLELIKAQYKAVLKLSGQKLQAQAKKFEEAERKSKAVRSALEAQVEGLVKEVEGLRYAREKDADQLAKFLVAQGRENPDLTELLDSKAPEFFESGPPKRVSSSRQVSNPQAGQLKKVRDAIRELQGEV